MAIGSDRDCSPSTHFGRQALTSDFDPLRTFALGLLWAMSLTRPWMLSATLLLGACGPSPEYFAQRCQDIAGIEVQNRNLWREYLRERKEQLATGKVTVNGKEIDPTDLHPVVGTKTFTVTNDWVLNGRPGAPTGKPYRNDKYIVHNSTGERVARFRDLNARVRTFEITLSWTCTDNHPHLYTGGPAHTGMIASSSR
jgi:hypothetical protein